MPALYSEKLLDHFRRPRNYGALTAPALSGPNLKSCAKECAIRLKKLPRLKRNRKRPARPRPNIGC